MITENTDIVALTAQADIHRLYVKVIQPALAEFVPAHANILGENEEHGCVFGERSNPYA